MSPRHELVVGPFGDVVPRSDQRLELRERRVDLLGHRGSVGFLLEDLSRQLPELTQVIVEAEKLMGILKSGGADPNALAQQFAVVQSRIRHILIRTNEMVSEADARRKLLDLRQRIVSGGADFGELARANSDDGTAARGGELDWVFPGDTVPEFEQAYEQLKVGEVSQPVRTPFGYHLIQVLERRSGDASVERKRLQARQAIRDRKAEEAYTEWLRQLRDQTYVELRLEEK